jgi:hypothetical protein
MSTFEIVWESGNKTELTGETIEDAVSRAGYDKCVLEKMISYKKIKNKNEVKELLERQNDYIDGVRFF